MEEVTISYDLVYKLKKKYNFSNLELSAIFEEKQEVFSEKNGIDFANRLKNPGNFLEIINDEEKLKERIKQLYERNKSAKKLYVKVFGKDEKICSKEKMIRFRNKFGLSTEIIANIFGVSATYIEAIESDNKNYISKIPVNIDLKYYINNEDEFYNLTLNAFKKGKISYNVFRIISNVIGKEKMPKKGKRKYIKCDTEREELNKLKGEEEKMQRTSTSMSKKEFKEDMERRKKLQKARKRINELRSKAKKEEETEFNGGNISCKIRKEFIYDLYILLENEERISEEDISIVKNAILYNEEAVSSEGIKVCVIGTLRNKGYDATMEILNTLIHDLDKKKYRNELQEFQQTVEESYKKMKEEESER